MSNVQIAGRSAKGPTPVSVTPEGYLIAKLSEEIPLPEGAANSEYQDLILTAITGPTPSGDNFIGTAGSLITAAAASFNRPGTTPTYAVGQLIANNATAGSVTPLTLTVSRANDKPVIIRRVRLKTSNTGAAGAVVRVHLYRSIPTCSNGDAGTWLTTESDYLGSFDVTLNRTFTDAVKGESGVNEGTDIMCYPATGSRNIYALLEARSAFTGGAGATITLTVEAIQN